MKDVSSMDTKPKIGKCIVNNLKFDNIHHVVSPHYIVVTDLHHSILSSNTCVGCSDNNVVAFIL